jgi:GT2 family glycosyltransferase
MIDVCIPVLNRYDLLLKLITSLENGTRKPRHYFIFDNGGKLESRDLPANSGIFYALDQEGNKINIGVAKSWNFLIHTSKDPRIILNDDLEFGKDALELLEDGYDETVICAPNSLLPLNLFSCFMLGDYVFDKVGDFDEFISPNYAYFEDNDYAYRMKLLGIGRKYIDGVNIKHNGSSTLKAFTPKQRGEHNKRFELARENYVKKWGGMPEHETYLKPFNRS